MAGVIIPTHQIDFQPTGKRVSVGESTSLLSAAQEAGVALSAICGGVGVCQDCKIRVEKGETSGVTKSEREVFSEEQLAQGWRLACQVYPLEDLVIDVPPESMTTTQRLQTEGLSREIPLEPMVKALDFMLPQPDLADLRADWERFVEEVRLEHYPDAAVALPVLAQFSGLMRSSGWEGRSLVDKDQGWIGFVPAYQPYFGLAVDIGTTKMAAFLVNLSTGETVGKTAAMNPQIVYGEDVVSRIAYANQGVAHRHKLQECVISDINQMARELCREVKAEPSQIADAVVVGNTAMHHLIGGLSVRQLGEAPYVPAVRGALRFPAREIGLEAAPGAMVYMPPNIAGYVGADHTAMLLAAGLHQATGICLALDIGTNTEMSLVKEGQFVCCSCASGPAFEGAHIHAGMRAVPGAVERAEFYQGQWLISTVGEAPPVGICGSGILDVVAALLASGQIDGAGRFTESASRLVDYPQGGAIVLVPGEKTGTGKDILVTRSDVREIQLAKAAIRAGVDALFRATDTSADEIDQFLVAGAFGTYLSLESAVAVGMFPRLAPDRYRQIGNAAGIGAQQMLVSRSLRQAAESILLKMDYIELTTDPGFMESYVDAMVFDQI